MCVYVCVSVCVCVCVPEGQEAGLGQMVHKGVTTQWVGTAIDALQHPRRWNIWLLTRSQNSLALPSPYLAAAREPAGDFGQNKHTHTHRDSEPSTFPPSREPASAARWKLLPRLCKEVMMVVRAGRRTETSQTQGYCVTLGWRRSDLELILRGLVSEGAPYDLISACNV